MNEPVGRSLHDADIAATRRELLATERLLMQKIEAVDKLHTEISREHDKAVEAALAAANEKAAAHNDVLGAMKDQQSLFYTKEQAINLTTRVELLEKHQIADTGKDKGIGLSASVLMQLLLAATLIISIVVFFANK